MCARSVRAILNGTDVAESFINEKRKMDTCDGPQRCVER